MPENGSYVNSLLRPDSVPRWSINGHTMIAEGPWLKNDGRIEVVPAAPVDYARQFLDDLAHLRCEDDCEGFRDPCAACVVHEARRRLGNPQRTEDA